MANVPAPENPPMKLQGVPMAFSLSETSFALFPPLESHEGELPVQPSVGCAPSVRGASIPELEPVIPAALASPVSSNGHGSPVVARKGTRVRGDSYADLINLEAAEGSEEQFSQLMLQTALNYPPPPHRTGSIVMVTSYTQFSDLAHGPRGTEAKRAVRTYRLNIIDGTLTMLSMVPEGCVHNPAFCRWHPKLDVVYACTESVKQEGKVVAFHMNGKTGALREHGDAVGAGGTSTCYLTIHKKARRMLLVNYWDSTICTLELLPDGKLGKLLQSYDPKQGRKMKASADTHVNHSRNDEAAQAERQGDPHSHAIVLEPSMGNIAYVPDLGMDLIRQFAFDEESGKLTPCGEMVSGVKMAGRGLGPRYLVFAKDVPTCYVVNELSSQVAVFQYHPEVAAAIGSATTSAQLDADAKAQVLARAQPTLTLVQTVSTLPEAFPREMNTCGRVTIHPTGDFVITSNRGHDSVAVHRVHKDSKPPGMLTLAGIFHTRGETPRHFQFDRSGQWLLVANQDSNTVAVFAFNSATGQVSYTGNTYACHSPNFVCLWAGA